MQVSATAPLREHEKPMSWARAILIATGFFFVTAILLGQIPSYFFTISTLSTLARFEQGFLDLGLLALGLGLICFEVVYLYDVRPLVPWQLFAIVGIGLAAVGVYMDYQVFVGIHATNVFGVGGWSEYLPDKFHIGQNTVYWPIKDQGYLFNPVWFQAQSIDLSAVGLIALYTGLGMLGFAVLCPLVLSNRLVGPLRDIIVRAGIGLGVIIAAIWLCTYTWAPSTVMPTNGAHGPLGNILLFIGLGAILFGLQAWLLPVMMNARQQFMPAVYLHGVVGLIGSVAVPLLVLWAIVYPVVDAIHSADNQEFWVQCSVKTDIPGSCTFTPFTGYIICAVVFGNLFALAIAGLYFWSTRRNTVVLAGTIAMVYLALAAQVIHVDDPVQLSMGFVIAIGIAVTAFVYTWATQREFAPTAVQQLGCLGQWLVLGTLWIIFLFGYAFFSLPKFFELESGLALFYNAGPHAIHDAFWGAALMGGLLVLQLVLLSTRKINPLDDVRMFVLATLLIAVVFEVASGIMGFTTDILSQGVTAMQASQVVAIAGLCFEAAGVLAALYGAARARGLVNGWTVSTVILGLIGTAWSFITYYMPGYFPELVISGFVIAMLGAFAYAAAGPSELPEHMVVGELLAGPEAIDLAH